MRNIYIIQFRVKNSTLPIHSCVTSSKAKAQKFIDYCHNRQIEETGKIEREYFYTKEILF